MSLVQLKPRSPPERRSGQDPLLPRSHSSTMLLRVVPERLADGFLRRRVLRGILTALISLVLAANSVWAAQAVAAWRRGGGSAQKQQLLLQQLNSTTLSLEVSEVGAEAGEPSTYVVSAQLVKGGHHGQQNSTPPLIPQPAAVVDRAAANTQQQQQVQQVQQQQQQQERSGDDSLTAAGKPGRSSDGRPSSSDTGDGAVVALLPTQEALPPPPHRAVLKLAEEEGGSSDLCAQALQVPKVALLFLTRGDLFHAATWHAWLAAAADLLPAEQLHAATCASAFADTKGSAEGGRVRQPGHRTQQKKVAAAPAAAPTLAAAAPVAELEPGPGLGLLGQRGAVKQAPRWLLQPAALAAACGWTVGGGAVPPTNSGSGSVIDRQHLFSVYVHAPPNVTDDQLPEVFRGRLIPDRILPEWGTHQLVEATRSLLWEAYKDPLNQRFVLLSESDIPLYDPLTFHQQLTAEGKSRVNACANSAPTDIRRWSWRMAGHGVTSAHWRKSSQWFGMVRSHVKVVLDDVTLFRKFEDHCKNGWDGEYKRWRDCFSDEHYIPTLLAVHGLDNETYCSIDGLVAADWSAGGAHPKAYKSWETRPKLIQQARGTQRGCDSSAAIADAQQRYLSKQEAFGAGSGKADSPAALCTVALAGYEHPLPGTCSLTVRKFPKPTVRAVHKLFSDCSNGLHLLGTRSCKH